MLYAGTTKPIPRSEWKKDAPAVSVRSLLENELSVSAHFANPKIQFIGSTAGCGCDFPHVLLQGNEWPSADETEIDAEYEETCGLNRKALVQLF